ncbi:MAG: LacI family transcriptional regulator [Propionibacteriaceae bacterium]|nr:LacI family transcriptional regulator [Propionibacteriaceae bacterium]
MTTLREIAARAGVSISTASRALSDQAHVEVETRRRVKAVATEMGYVPNALARDLRRNQTRTIGLLLPDMRYSSFASDSSALIQVQLQERGYGMVIYATRHDRETELRCLERLHQQQVDGIIHVPTSMAGSENFNSALGSIPMMEFLRPSASTKLDAVIYDGESGAKAVIDYLFSLGHRHIGVIAGPKRVASTLRRLDGARRAIAEANLPDARLSIVHGEYSPDTGRNAIHRLVTQSDQPTAVFATSAQFVLGAMLATKEIGLHIPKDLSLAGFGDPEWGKLISPGLTTYALPLHEMAMTAVLLITSRVEHPPQDDHVPVRVTIAGNLVIRESTAPVAV